MVSTLLKEVEPQPEHMGSYGHGVAAANFEETGAPDISEPSLWTQSSTFIVSRKT